MKVHAYILCHNEEDIIEKVLEYYSDICTKIFVFDNESTDRSVEIAESFDKVQVVPFVTGGKKDNKLHVTIKTQAYKEYSREGGRYTTEVADWVICVDMDELVYHPNLLEVLEEYRRDGVTVPHITGFNMVGRNEFSRDEPLLSQYREGVRDAVFDKRAIFDVNFDMAYSPGCHSFGAGFDYMKAQYGYKASGKHSIALLHYKHIGSRLYDSSVRNLERFSLDDIKVDSEGRYSGPGSHYKFFVDKAFDVSPFLKRAELVIDEVGNVLFDKFASSTGETPYNQQGNSLVSGKDIEFLIGLAAEVVDVDRSVANSLIKVLKKYKPSSEVLRKVERCLESSCQV